MTGSIGLFGGTFDPVHRGHLKTVAHLAAELALRPVLFLLNARPPHRGAPVASASQRREMLALALADYPGFQVDDRELHRRGPSYSVWTLRALRAAHRQRPLCLILGADAFAGLGSWFHWEEVLTLVHIVVMPRPGWRPREVALPVRFGVAADLQRRPAGSVVVCEVPPVPVSATAVRARIAAGEGPGGDVPDAVWLYIQRQGLYGVDNTSTRGKHAG